MLETRQDGVIGGLLTREIGKGVEEIEDELNVMAGQNSLHGCRSTKARPLPWTIHSALERNVKGMMKTQ